MDLYISLNLVTNPSPMKYITVAIKADITPTINHIINNIMLSSI